jgi:hypothetical protein
MEHPPILPLIGVILAFILMVISIVNVVIKVKAKKQLITHLKTDKAYLSLMAHDEFVKQLAEGRIAYEDLRPAREVVEQSIQSFEKKARKAIKEALYQPTVEGRRRFLTHVLLDAMPDEQTIINYPPKKGHTPCNS